MPTLRSILKPFETLAVAFGDEQVTVTFRPQYLTPEFEERLKALNTEDNATAAFLELFCSVIERWDLTADDASPDPIPITPGSLRLVPYDILGAILSQVQEAVVPNPQTGPTSAGTSQPAGASGPSLSGTV